MPIKHVLAVVPVSDIDRSEQWYASLFGRPADNNPMPTLVEWQVLPGAWVQVFSDPERAGRGLLNFAVDDLEKHLAEIGARGIASEADRRRQQGRADVDGDRPGRKHDRVHRGIPRRLLS